MLVELWKVNQLGEYKTREFEWCHFECGILGEMISIEVNYLSDVNKSHVNSCEVIVLSDVNYLSKVNCYKCCEFLALRILSVVNFEWDGFCVRWILSVLNFEWDGFCVWGEFWVRWNLCEVNFEWGVFWQWREYSRGDPLVFLAIMTLPEEHGAVAAGEAVAGSAINGKH